MKGVERAAVARLRVVFGKGGALQYCSHLDLARVWERTLRRAGLPLAYSHGFNPRPKLQLAAALPLGHTSGGEVLDIWLERPVNTEAAAAALGGVLPEGLTVGAVKEVLLSAPALQAQIISAEYLATVEWSEPAQQVEARIAQLLASAEVPYDRRGRIANLRPLIERLWLERTGDGCAVLGMQLAARASATARPEAVLEALGMGTAFARYHRLRLLW